MTLGRDKIGQQKKNCQEESETTWVSCNCLCDLGTVPSLLQASSPTPGLISTMRAKDAGSHSDLPALTLVGQCSEGQPRAVQM